MRHFFTYALLAAMTVAQANAQTLLNQMEKAEVQQEIKEKTAHIATLQCNFLQQKHMSGMSTDLKSTGDLHFKKNGMVRMDYTSPFKYTLVINQQKLMTLSGGRKNIINLKDKQQGQQGETMISACMAGDFSALEKNFNIDIYATPQQYIVKATPVKKNKSLSELEFTMDRATMHMIAIKMTEGGKNGNKGNDYTQYTFSQIKAGLPIADSMFEIK